MNKEIFSFSGDQIKNYIKYDLKLLNKMKTSFKYICGKIPQNNSIDLASAKWYKTKNYDWCFIKIDNVSLLIRQYRNNFTFYTKNENSTEEYFSMYSIFTFDTNKKMLSDDEKDERIDDWFYDINNYLLKLIELIKNDKVGWLWNDITFKREKYIDVQTVFDYDNIHDIDLLIFACEEIFQLHLELFSQNEVVEKLKELKVGDIFTHDSYGNVTIHRIKSEVENEDYHYVGLETINVNGKKDWHDVYSLSRWYYDKIFK